MPLQTISGRESKGMPAIVSFFFDNGYAFELLLAFSLFAYGFKRRSYFVLRYLLVLCVLLATSMIWNTLQIEESFPLSWIKYLIMMMESCLGVVFCRRTSVWGALFCLVGGVSTQHLYFRLVSLILSLTEFDYDSIFRMVITFVVLIGVYVGVFFLFRKPLKDVAGIRPTGRINILIGLVIIVVAVFLHLFEGTRDLITADRPLLSIFSVYGIFCCIFALGTQYSLFRNSRLSVDKAVLEKLVYKQKEQYEHSKETIDIINVKCHDMKRQISLLESRVEPEALDEIKNLIKVYETSYHTGNEVLDVFLAERSLSFERNLVQFNCIVDGECLDFMKPSEIYALFGNAFDNAIEALLGVPEEDRIFTLSVKRQLALAVIHMENVYDTALVFEDGLPMTTKEDLDYHGFGMRSIRMVAEKYKGTVTVQAKDGMFNLNILLPIPNAE